MGPLPHGTPGWELPTLRSAHPAQEQPQGFGAAPGSGSRRVSSAGHRDSDGCGRQMSAQPWHWEKPVRRKAAGFILSLF